MKPARSQPERVAWVRPFSQSGFTLIELIGVLAILSILAGILLPGVIRQITTATGTKEDRTLEALGEVMGRYVAAEHQIPGPSTFFGAASRYLNVSSNQAAWVDPNDANTARVLLIHPNFTPSTGNDPIYVPTAAGATTITNARMMLISSTRTGLALPVSSGKAASVAAFENIWNWTCNAATEAPPSGWPAGWNNNGEYLHVQRLNLAPLFHHAAFSNIQFPTNVPFAKFDGLATYAFDTTNAMDAYYLRGTLIRLYKHDTPYGGSPPANPDELDVTLVVECDVNFVYQDGQWKVP